MSQAAEEISDQEAEILYYWKTRKHLRLADTAEDYTSFLDDLEMLRGHTANPHLRGLIEAFLKNVFIPGFGALGFKQMLPNRTAVLEALRASSDGRCDQCEGPFRTQDLDVNHVKPLHAGGATTADNCMLLCRSCNQLLSQA